MSADPVLAFSRWLPTRLAAALLLALLAACERKHPKQPPATPSPAAPVAPARKPEPAAPRYFRVELKSPKDLLDLQENLGRERMDEVLKLNRLDLAHARKGSTLLVPATGVAWKTLAPFPERWAEVADQPKLLVVSLRLQAWAAYEAGALIRWGPTSTGKKKSPTPAGLYHTNWCQKARTSTFNDEWELKW